MQKRVIIVDFNHMAFNFYWMQSQTGMSCTVVENGQAVTKQTGIQSGSIKNIHRWSKGGVYPTAVCFDRAVPARKLFFATAFPDMQLGTDSEYKGGREKMPDGMFEGIQDSENILRRAGVSVFSQMGYEADDLIYACVKRAKVKYPDYPIDIITNDADLLPLVDEQVSVFLRSKVGTYAVSKDLEKNHYIQVTPENFQDTVEHLSAFKGFTMPYNSVLLYKLLRGDPSDKYKRKDVSAMYSPKKWNAMIENMLADGVDFAHIFRYGDPQYKILYRDSGKEYEGTLKEALASPDRDRLYQKIQNSKEIDEILRLLKEYSPISDEQLEHVEKTYWGMNLNQIYPNSDKRCARRAYVVGTKATGDINPFDEIELQKQLTPLRIHLRMN